MAEERILMGPDEVEYDGIFSVRDVNRTIMDFFLQMGYLYFEKVQTETVGEKGKDIYMKGEFRKKLNYYADSVIIYKIKCKNITDVEIVRENHKVSMNKGGIRVEMDAVLRTDLEGRFEVSLMAYLIRAFSERFFFKRDIDYLAETIVKDYKKAIGVIRGFLNLQKYN